MWSVILPTIITVLVLLNQANHHSHEADAQPLTLTGGKLADGHKKVEMVYLLCAVLVAIAGLAMDLLLEAPNV